MKSNKKSSSNKTEGKPSSPAPKSSKTAKAKTVEANTTKKSPKAATKTATKASAKTRAQAPSKMQVPPILLEGDQTPSAPVSGPGQRFSLGPTAPVEQFTAPDLPEAYGTKQLFLTARDPHWIFAAWDLTNDQLRHYNALSIDHHLILRVYEDDFTQPPLSQIHVHPESRNWFVPVPHAGAKYVSELGYYEGKGRWVSISKSGATLTPPDSLADDFSARFATISPDVPFKDLIELVKSIVQEHVPLAEALQQLRAEGFKNLPNPSEIAAGRWTAAQEKALGEVVSMDQVRRIWIGSVEITELIRRQFQMGISSMSAAAFGVPGSAVGASWGAISSISSVSSPFGGAQKGRGFWFNVNAELIIYGATEPDAKVTIGDRQIKLRPDGSFSYRFSLPDGEYSLPAVATSADKVESRSAALEFSRSTEYAGEVGKHPQDETLRPPLVSSVS